MTGCDYVQNEVDMLIADSLLWGDGCDFDHDFSKCEVNLMFFQLGKLG